MVNILTLGVFVAGIFGSIKGSCDQHLQFVDYRDPILDSRCHPLSMETILDPQTQQVFDTMLTFARGEQGNQQKHVLVGLSAPQVGFDMRVILVDTKADGRGGVAELRVYVNPEILEYSEEMEEWYEGCYSTGNVKGVVKRPSRVKIKALDRSGREVIEAHSGYVARIFQHEIDHLNGIRFPDRVPENERLHIVKAEEMYLYRNQLSWRDWKATIPQKEWKDHVQ